MKLFSRQQGSKAEDRALAYLKRQGLKPVTRNYNTRRGEIDLIMRDGDTLVFVEVRQRSNPHFADGLESVTAVKQQRLAAAASHYLQSRGGDEPCRFDVVAIDGEGRINWIANAFEVSS